MSICPKVSVIIPVYNKEQYIDDFILSMQQQTLKEMEFIFINDQGQDNSFELVCKAATNDSRIVCIENDVNRGPGYSRNKGIAAAQGEFIAFADADDIVAEDFYELLYNKAKQTGALVVKGRRIKRDENGVEEITPLDEKIRRNINAVPTMLNMFNYEHTTAIYSNDLVRSIGARNAPDSKYDEDTCFQMMVMHRLKPSQFAMEEKALYVYRKVGTSLMHSAKGGEYMEQIKRSALFKLDFILPRLQNMEDAKFLANVFEQRLGCDFDECEQGGAPWDAMLAYINDFAERLKIWKNASEELYHPGTFAREFERYNYNAEAFCRLRRLLRLEQKMENLKDSEQPDLNYIRIAFNYKKLQRRCTYLWLLSHITVSSARVRYAQEWNARQKELQQYKNDMKTLYPLINSSFVSIPVDNAGMEKIKQRDLDTLDALLAQPCTTKAAATIASIFESRLGRSLDLFEQRGAPTDVVVSYVEAFGQRLRTWKNRSDALYSPGMYAQELERYNFNSETFCRLRRLQRLEKKIANLSHAEESDLKYLWIATHYTSLHRQYSLLKFFSLFTFGKLRKQMKYRQKMIKLLLRQFKNTMKEVKPI